MAPNKIKPIVNDLCNPCATEAVIAIGVICQKNSVKIETTAALMAMPILAGMRRTTTVMSGITMADIATKNIYLIVPEKALALSDSRGLFGFHSK